MKHKIIVFSVVVCALSASVVRADDSIVADYGKTVFPQQTEKIKMVSEKVDITFGVDEKGRREAKVNCHFVFRNETKDEIKVKVGFPGNKSEHGPAWRQPLRDFTAFVDGKPYQTEVKEERLGDDPTDPQYSYREWYLWEMSFPPKKDTLVDNSYSYSLSSDSGYAKLTLNYELATGANWAGEIGEAVVTIKYADAKDLEDRVISIHPAGWTRKGNQIIWTLKNIEPGAADNIAIQEKNLNSTVTHYAGSLLFGPQSKMGGQSQKSYNPEQFGEVSLTALRGQDARVRRGKSSTIENLVKQNNAAAIDKLLEYLGDSDALVKSMAIRALGKMKAKQAVQPLARRMGDSKENWRVRLDAAKTQAQIGDPEALPAIIKYLRAVCLMPQDTVLSPNTDKSYGTDRDFLASQITVHAVIELAKNHPSSSSNLLEAVTGEEGLTDFKFFLAQALGQLGKKEISPILLEYLKNSPNGIFRERAASILGDLGDKNAIDALEVALKDGYLTEYTGDVEGRTPSYAVRLAAYKSLGQLGIKVQRTGDDYIVVK